MFQFVRTEDHPLLSDLTASHFALIEAEKLLSQAIRCRNQTRSELVVEPEDTKDWDKQEKYRTRQESYTSAILQERCALTIAYKAMVGLVQAIMKVSDRLKDNKEPEYKARHDPDQQPLRGFLIDLARHNVACAVALYQQALKTFTRGRVTELNGQQTTAIQGTWWSANSFIQHQPRVFSRDERWPETIETYAFFVKCACELADHPDGWFTISIDDVSPQSISQVVKAFEDAGWETNVDAVWATNVGAKENFDSMSPLQIRGLKPAKPQ